MRYVYPRVAEWVTLRGVGCENQLHASACVRHWYRPMLILVRFRSRNEIHKEWDKKVSRGQIREYSDPNQWHYISAKHNLADKLTGARNRLGNTLFNGSKFLCKWKSEWPQKKTASQKLCESDPEVKSGLCSNATAICEMRPIEKLYSSWYQMHRAVAWLLCLVNRLKNSGEPNRYQWPLLLTWITFNPSMDK